MKAIRKHALIPTVSVGLFLASCSGPTQVTLPDGTLAYRIDCGASVTDMNYCFEKAGKSCGADGYRIVGRDGEVLGTSEAAAADSVKAVKAWQTDRNSIFIVCGT